MAGREVLKLGLGWTMGDGASIHVWRDPWLSVSSPLRPIGPPNEANRNLMVSALLSPVSNAWNVEAIRLHLPQYEDFIRKLLPSSRRKKDTLVWLPDKSGIYTSRTGYMLSKLHSTAPALDTFKWNSNIWLLSIPPKLKMFLWKLKRRALPVGNNLAIRGITGDFLCKCCGEVENELHILLLCPYARRVWDLAPLHRKPREALITSVALVLEAARRFLPLPPIGLINSPLGPWILWQLRKSRNLRVFESRNQSEWDTISTAIMAAKEWQESQETLRGKASKTPLPDIPLENPTHPFPRSEAPSQFLPLTEASLTMFPSTEDLIYELPPSEVVSCFVDAAWSANTGFCGMGWLFKSSNNQVLHQGSASRTHSPSALASEALAMKSALSAASRMDLTSIYVYSDSKVLLSLLTTETSMNELQGILHDIAFLRRSFSHIKFFFVSRKFNVLANALAKTALSVLSVKIT